MPARHRLATLAALAAPAAALSMAGGAWAGQDRYGPPAVRDPADAAQPAPLTYLSWPGKAAPAPGSATTEIVTSHADQSLPTPRQAPPAQGAIASRSLPTSIYAPASQARAALVARPLRPAETAVATTRPAPAAAAAKPPARLVASSAQRPAPGDAVSSQATPSPPAKANPQPAAVAANGTPPRFYSVQRQFGGTPDPAPLPAQFFADGASNDLAGPPPPPAPRLIPGQSASSAANVQRAAAAANIADGDATTGD